MPELQLEHPTEVTKTRILDMPVGTMFTYNDILYIRILKVSSSDIHALMEDYFAVSFDGTKFINNPYLMAVCLEAGTKLIYK